ncbi:hypothetical protein ACEPAI_4431 [Sanghuangporus weigelae]
MGRKSFFCSAQREWLASQVQRFRTSQEADSTPTFFSAIYEEFLLAFPISPAVMDQSREIYKADLGKRIKNWFYNQKSNPGS